MAGLVGLSNPNLNTSQGADDNKVQIPVQQTNNSIDYGSGIEKTMAEIQSMSETDFDNYLKQAQGLDIDGVLPNVDTQKVIYAMGLNGTPTIVDSATFNKTSGSTLYRTVNWFSDGKVKVSATEILDQMTQSSLNRLGSGIYGDGHYFADTQRGSNSYGRTRGNINATAFVRMKLNNNAKSIDASQLERMLRNDNSPSARRIRKMSGVAGYGSGGTDNALSVYALRKGYNVITNGNGYYNVIDRSVMIIENTYSPI